MTDLFRPFDLSGLNLQNRIVMAPMTRARASNDVADELTALYYTQRATAGLIVSEGTSISREGRSYLFNPGIYSAAQIDGLKLVTDSVHAIGGHIFAQLWHVGRVSHPSIQDDGKLPVSPSSQRAKDSAAYGYNEKGEPDRVEPPAPRQLHTDEVERIVEDFAQAAENAIHAGFDGVERGIGRSGYRETWPKLGPSSVMNIPGNASSTGCSDTLGRLDRRRRVYVGLLGFPEHRLRQQASNVHTARK